MNTAKNRPLIAALLEAILLTSAPASASEIQSQARQSITAAELGRAVASVPGLGRSILDFGV